MKESLDELEPVQELQMTVWPDGKEDFPTKKEIFEHQNEIAAWTRAASEILNDLIFATRSILQSRPTEARVEAEDKNFGAGMATGKDKTMEAKHTAPAEDPEDATEEEAEDLEAEKAEEGQYDPSNPKPEAIYKPLGDGSKLWTRDSFTIRRDQVPEHVLKQHEGITHREIDTRS